MSENNHSNEKPKHSWSLTILASLPLLLMLLLLIINADYVSQLWVNLPPRIDFVPCGWILLAVFVGLIIMTRLVLWLASAINWLPGTIILATIAFFLIVAASALILLGPAAFQVLRNEALRQVIG